MLLCTLQSPKASLHIGLTALCAMFPQGGLNRIKANIASRVKKGRMKPAEAEAALKRVKGALDYNDFKVTGAAASISCCVFWFLLLHLLVCWLIFQYQSLHGLHTNAAASLHQVVARAGSLLRVDCNQASSKISTSAPHASLQRRHHTSRKWTW